MSGSGQMANEQTVFLVRNPERVPCQLRWAILEDQTCQIILEAPAGIVRVAGRDLFDALQEVRRALAPDGWIIAVQGARTDAYPSGMVRDMLGGRQVYLLQLGRHVARDHLVNTLAEADVRHIGTVEEQIEFYRLWRISRATTPRPD